MYVLPEPDDGMFRLANSHVKRRSVNVQNVWLRTLDGHTIGDFRVAFRLCFKASSGAKHFLWKLVLFTCTVPQFVCE